MLSRMFIYSQRFWGYIRGYGACRGRFASIRYPQASKPCLMRLSGFPPCVTHAARGRYPHDGDLIRLYTKDGGKPLQRGLHQRRGQALLLGFPSACFFEPIPNRRQDPESLLLPLWRVEEKRGIASYCSCHIIGAVFFAAPVLLFPQPLPKRKCGRARVLLRRVGVVPVGEGRALAAWPEQVALHCPEKNTGRVCHRPPAPGECPRRPQGRRWPELPVAVSQILHSVRGKPGPLRRASGALVRSVLALR